MRGSFTDERKMCDKEGVCECEREERAKERGMSGRLFRKLNTWKKKLCVAVIAVLTLSVIVAGWILFETLQEPEPQREIVTVSTLEKIIEVDELSTFTAVYNGIATVNNEKKPKKVDYYVAYEAKVYAGINFEAVYISVNEEAKRVDVLLPPVSIHKINVDIASLDFIFVNDKANTSSVTQQAYRACEADVQQEAEQQEAICELAQQNAENVVRALIAPILEQSENEYALVIN